MALVNITKRVRIEGKGWRFCEVVFGANRKIRPNAVLIDGKEQVHPEGRYYIDFLQDGQRKRLAAGATAAEAAIAADQQTRTLTARRAAADAGITLPQSKPPAGSRLLQEAVETYLLEIEAHKKKKTHSAYRTALTYFLESCKKQTLEEIHRTDMLAFKTYLRDKKKQSDRSIANKFENVMSFLKQQKITGLIGKNDWPTFTEEEVETYTQDELDKFFAACTETENVWFEFFYRTAMREQEVMHVSWSDIDFERSAITVRENKRFGWKPKAYKGRYISGGTPTRLTSSAGEELLGPRWPQFLPDGRRFLYFVGSGKPHSTGVYLGSLDRPTEKTASPVSIQEENQHQHYSSNGNNKPEIPLKPPVNFGLLCHPEALHT